MRYKTEQDFINSKLEKYQADKAECLGKRRYRLRCKDCATLRDIWYTTGPNGPQKCECKRLVGHQSFSFHSAELKANYPEYQLISFKKHPEKCKYQHTCGHTFESQRLAFKRIQNPCSVCRPLRNKDPQVFESQFNARGFKNVVLKSSYVDHKTKLTLGFRNCSHTVVKDGFSILAYPKSAIEKCPICFPKWQHIEVGGKNFVLRSGVERRFVEFLVHERKIPAKDIWYEPREFAVPYKEATTGKDRKYYPDFKVRNALIEIKNMASLGLTSWYLYKEGKEVFKDNRAKFVAAKKQIKDFRIYVETKNGFRLVKSLNRNKLKKDLL